MKNHGPGSGIRLVLLFLFCMEAWAWLAPSPATAQGLPVIRPLIRPALDQRPIVEASRVSLRVVRPRLEVVGGRSGGLVSDLILNEDGSVLLTVMADGSARWWDLERGVQVGGALGRAVEAGALRGRGSETDAVVVARGSVLGALSLEGVFTPLAAMGAQDAPGSSYKASGASPALSDDGRVFAVRRQEGWRVLGHGVEHVLGGSTGTFRPRFSSDGRRVLYHGMDGTFRTRDLSGLGDSGRPARINGCGDGAAVTAGTVSPDGQTVILGDASGTVCLRRILVRSPDEGSRVDGANAEAHVRVGAHNARVRLIVMDRGGVVAATVDDDGQVQVWSLAEGLTRIAALALGANAAGPLALDARRRWIFSGQPQGTVAVHAYGEDGAQGLGATGTPLARLISTRDGGWMVVDRRGRFDGTRRGADALLWAADLAVDTLPINAFSESYFEPGLLAKLDSTTAVFLNADPRNLINDGYEAPPPVSIEAVEAGALEAGSPARVRVRLDDPDYPRAAIAAVRLYHNGKLLPDERLQADPRQGVYDFEVALLAGENRFHAVGVGPAGVEGRSAVTPPVMVPDAALERPRMQVVSVGINEYVKPKWELGSAGEDARAVGKTLDLRGGTLFNEVDVVTLVDSLASANAIKERIADHTLSPEDVLVVFLAGHGVPLEREDGGKEWYFLPYASVWGQPFASDWGQPFASDERLHNAIRRHGVSGSELLRLLTRAPARRVFLVLDSCYSGAMLDLVQGGVFDDAAERKALRELARVGGIHVLAAARADEMAVELLSETHGALTFLILEGVRGRADTNGDNRVTVREIVDYAVREMPLLSRRLARERGIREDISQLPVGYSRGENFPLAGL